MYKLQLNTHINFCLDIDQISDNNWQIVENYDGTVSLFDIGLTNISSIIETKPCCETLGYTFDLENQKCRWGEDKSLCDILGNDPFKLVLNPNNDGGVLFNVGPNETCFFDISFDYLFKFECEDILKAVEGVKSQKNLENEEEIKNVSSEITNQEDNITILSQQIETEKGYNIPYVIQCVNSTTTTNTAAYYNKSGQIKTVTNNQKDAYDSENTNSAFIKKIPPGAYGAQGGDITNYCLTEAGLFAWNVILGEETYNKWFQSNGIDTSLYTCLEVEQLVNEHTIQGGLIETKCDYSLYDKDISLKKISELEIKLTEANNKKNELNIKLVGLETENNEDLPNKCELLSIFEDFSVDFTLETLNPTTNTLETVYSESIMNIGSGNIYDYIKSTSGDTGILISGFSSCESGIESASTPPKCIELKDLLYDSIYLNRFLPFNEPPSNQAESIKLFNELNCWYRQKCWLNYETRIQGDIINQLNGKDINMSLRINNSCADFSVLLDRIKINKDCTNIDNVEKLISEPPKFDIVRVADNKKSWVANDFKDERVFELKYRGTEYEANHHKLIINTKEVDLNLSPARAVEQDVWCYINQNNCILEGCDDSFSAFTCPSGYTLTSDADACVFTATTGTTSATTQYNVSTPYNFTRFNHYLNRGTLFVEDVTDKEWPIFWTGTPQNVWVGPYYNTDYLTASNGDYLTHSGFGDKTTDSGYLIWSSPDAFCAEFSEFGSSSTDLFNSKLNPNILWGGTVGDVSSSVFNNITGTGVAGRLYNRSIWTDSQSPLDEWIGLSYSFELDETKVYRIGFAADEKVRIKVNGEYLINSDLTPYHPINPSVNLFNSGSRFQQIYVVVGLTLLAGKNIIEAEGWNSQNAAGFVCEVYDATESVLRDIRYETELSGVTVFSTRSEIGSVFQLGEDSGYSCPTGYSLDTSISAPYRCIDIDKISRSDNQKNCCCSGFPLLIKGDDGITVELPLTGATGTTLDCSLIQTLIDDFIDNNIDGVVSYLDTLETLKCGNAYSLYSGTSSTGFLFSEENDGTIGVYEFTTLTGGTDTYVNVSDKVTSECCEIINSGFESYSNIFKQGVNNYPTVNWDPNKERCVYVKCGDDGCTNFDTLLTTELTEIDTVLEFGSVLSNELIDVKSRQTISGYPTLRMLYDRYNLHALDYCDVDSSRFDYFDMDNFGKSVGDYWIGLIEQVVPATTIWGSTYTYKNTIFDQQKYKYKQNNLYLCDNPSVNFPFSAISKDSSVSVETFNLTLTETNTGNTITTVSKELTTRNCNGVWIMQSTCNPEFLGTVSIMGRTGTNNPTTINENPTGTG